MHVNTVRRKENHIDSQGGYTLVEVLMAMAVFLIGILAVLMMQIKAIDTNASARTVTENYTWAMDKAEELLALNYDDAQLDVGEYSVLAGTLTQAADGIDNNADGRIDETGENGQISISWSVQNGPVDDTKWVQVTVVQHQPLARDKVINVDFIMANM